MVDVIELIKQVVEWSCMSSFGGRNGMNRQNDRTHTERMNDDYLNSAEVSAQ